MQCSTNVLSWDGRQAFPSRCTASPSTSRAGGRLVVLGGHAVQLLAEHRGSLGYVGVVMLGCGTAALRPLTRPFAVVGQTALTNYLLQTLICTTLF